MLRIIRTSRLNSQASALLQAQGERDQLLDANQKLTSSLETERQHAQDLKASCKQLGEQFERQKAAYTRACDERVQEARQQAEELQARAVTVPEPEPEELLYRYKNQVLTDVTITLRTKKVELAYGPRVELTLILRCAGCDFTRTDASLCVADDPESRQNFLADDAYGGAVKGDAQRHAERCRAVPLDSEPPA
ncbi:hypothetical protein OG422_31225 (plasmid) [Streptomyces sp. NBC_01525]|uniref:hypothetical protein n=1 Tax=Streptomyces sp. NBC_01525 TaxID=2903893 RepID=UPI002F91BCA9